MKKRTAVLIHGCHLQADLGGKPWEQIVWGLDDEGIPSLSGRAVMGLKVASDYAAELVIFSTGASERNGFLEGEYTRNFAYDLNEKTMTLSKLVGFDNPEHLRGFLENFSDLDLESQNTTEECRRNFRLCAKQGIERVILVSSPWHIERCHAEALKIAQEMRDQGETVPDIVAIASEGSTEGIVILEPPHRGDCPKTRWHEIFRRLFKLKPEQIGAAEMNFEAIFDALERHTTST